jgi:hypothetical protein
MAGSIRLHFSSLSWYFGVTEEAMIELTHQQQKDLQKAGGCWLLDQILGPE